MPESLKNTIKKGVGEKKMDKLLTIIIPAYNVSEYIDQCLSSLLENEEIVKYLNIIAVNDGSKDDTLEKMRVYEERYPESIRVIDKENGGHGSGINMGISLAEGQYLKVLDSDDWVNNDALTNLVFYIRDNADFPDMIINPYEYIWQPDGRHELSDYPLLPEKEMISFEQINRHEYLIPLHSMTIKTAIYQDNSLPSIDEKISYDDVEYILYPVPYVDSIVYLKPIIYQYRYGMNGQSVAPSNYIKRRMNHMQVIDALLNYFDVNKNRFDSDQALYFQNRMKWMICSNVNILLSMDDTKQSKKEFVAFVNRCKSFDLKIVPNGKLQLLLKTHFLGYSIISRYYRKKKSR